ARVEQHIEALARREKGFAHRFRPFDQAAIGADDGEVQRCLALDEGEPVDARCDGLRAAVYTVGSEPLQVRGCFLRKRI
ncbi:hypothetical protein, partial [Polaromonas sp. AER18D-145]|uniref:hypothetical protein n=1 Tax=Polaromonas sp. AER18D-145 TaxID=1977060 RepID=UPI0014830044